MSRHSEQWFTKHSVLMKSALTDFEWQGVTQGPDRQGRQHNLYTSEDVLLPVVTAWWEDAGTRFVMEATVQVDNTYTLTVVMQPLSPKTGRPLKKRTTALCLHDTRDLRETLYDIDREVDEAVAHLSA